LVPLLRIVTLILRVLDKFAVAFEEVELTDETLCDDPFGVNEDEV
jgi:hypothetical protein